MTTSYSNQCRICLEYGAQYPIFDSKNDPLSVYSKLTSCLKEKIEDLEIFPRFICEICNNTLDIVYNFVKQYKRTYEILKNNVPFIERTKIETDEKCFIEIKTECIQNNFLNDDSHFDDNDNELSCNNDEEIIKVETLDKSNKNKSNLQDLLQKLPNITVKKKVEKQPEVSLMASSSKSKESVPTIKKRFDNFKTNKLTSINSSKPKPKRQVTLLEKSIIEKYILGKNIETSSRKPEEPKKPEPPKKKPVKEPVPKEPYSRLCELCGAAFSSKDRYSQHKRTHVTDARNICPQCNQEFQSRYQLRKHREKEHTDLYKYVCDHCGLSFYYSKNLITHLQKGHSEDGSSKRNFECTTCGKNYKSSEILKRHVREVHLGLPPPKRKTTCSFCGQEFRSYKSLRTHKRKEHLFQNDLKAD